MLLDGAAVALYRAAEICGVASRIDCTEDADVWDELGSTYDRLLAAHGEVDSSATRLSVRVGRDHDVSEACFAAGGDPCRDGFRARLVSTRDAFRS